MNRFLPCLVIAACSEAALAAETLPQAVRDAEQRRIEVVDRITPATIAVFNHAGDNGGSGVIISSDGLALTNFHVVAPCGPFVLCGLPDGSVVEAVLVGLDPTGDIALVRLLDEREYPAAVIGDSDDAAVGDEVFVAGNPFMLADDLQPTVTHGVLSGVRRYQYPAGGVLEYADCLQTDAAINPGNSGGPLYDRDGRLIGINGRASFEKRGRVNVGVGYAVSINQVKRFVEQLKTGRVVNHGSLGATARTTADGRVLIDAVSPSSDAYRRGLRFGDRVLAVDGRPVASANALMNAIATRPDGWRTRITYRNTQGDQQAWVRLEPRRPSSELARFVRQQLAKPTPLNKESADLYRPRPGYANHAVARRAIDDLMRARRRYADTLTAAPWRIIAEDADGEAATLHLTDDRSEATLPSGRHWVETARPLEDQPGPPGSGGMLVALHAWRRFVVADEAAAKPFVMHGPTPWGRKGELAVRVDASFDAARVEYYLLPGSHTLIGVEAWLDDAADPCRLEFSEIGAGPAALGPEAPGVIVVSRGDETIARWKLTGTEAPR